MKSALPYIIFTLVAVAMFTGVGFYVAGWVTVLWLKAPINEVGITTWYSYWQHYGHYPSVGTKLKIAIGVSIGASVGVPLLIALGHLGRSRELHGSARFATPAEIEAAGLHGQHGIVVGKAKNKYLIFEGQQFTILAAPTRSGKGVGFVIPNLLQYNQSVVVLDIKQENFEITAGFRKRIGQDVYLFNPFAEDFRTHRYNPLEYISNDANYRISDVQAIGQAFYPDPANGKDPFFDQQARNLFLGIVLYLCETPGLPRTMGEVLRQGSGKGKPVKEYLQGLINSRNFIEVDEEQDVLDGDGCPKIDKETGEIKRRVVKVLQPREWDYDDVGDPPLSNHCLDALNRFLNTSDNTLTSILASLNAPLTIWANPIVDAATSCNDFDLRDVRRRKMSIYVGITPDHLAEAKLLVNVLFSQLVNLNTKELPKNNPDLKYQCLLLMDEFTSIGKIDIIATAVSYMAGYNLRLAPIIQSMSQLASTYGPEIARTLVTNHALQIIYAPREQKDANEYSEMLGYQTAHARNRSSSFGKGGDSVSRAEGEGAGQKRALMLPQELKELGTWKEVVLLENTKPILCDKIKYFEDETFTSRMLPQPAVPLIDVGLYQAIVEARSREVTHQDLDRSSDEEGRIDLSQLILDVSNVPTIPAEDQLDDADISSIVDAVFGSMGIFDDVEGSEPNVEAESSDEDSLGTTGSIEPSLGDSINVIEPGRVDEDAREHTSSTETALGDALVSDQQGEARYVEQHERTTAEEDTPNPAFDLSAFYASDDDTIDVADEAPTDDFADGDDVPLDMAAFYQQEG